MFSILSAVSLLPPAPIPKVLPVLILWLKSTWAFTQPGLGCRGDLEYASGNICCLKCPAGTRMASPCTRAGEEGTCEECDDGTYTEHANDHKYCFKCTQCRPDQEIVRDCTHTQEAECQCKPGKFCAPEQACEVCRKCLRCKEDEEIVRNCTSTTNTECKKRQPTASYNKVANGWVIGTPLVVCLVGVIIFAVWRHRRATDSRRSTPDRREAGKHDLCPTDDGNGRETQRPRCFNVPWQLVRAKSSAGSSDECKALQSLSSSASNSQHSLTGLSSSAFPAPPPRAVPTAPVQPDRREDVTFPKLVAVNGEASLRKCFEYFEEIDFNQHNRFFRHLGIVDNVIKSKDNLPYEDKIHDLLTIWVEKVGREATLNDLLQALLALNQRRTAEAVKEKALTHYHYYVE
ncbi:tumor necrosis factor receptor superfamily member 10B-like isoform X2 [Clinocottus analis]|uniref:tumor necrosis factor receptor superfamily member 10B-like isoform X2 n=1 Tax=Clinocottus analis TaxID=304258 RepID=UPI0035C20418